MAAAAAARSMSSNSVGRSCGTSSREVSASHVRLGHFQESSRASKKMASFHYERCREVFKLETGASNRPANRRGWYSHRVTAQIHDASWVRLVKILEDYESP